ncbi:hypothetical protein [Halobacillus salinus]|uniref:Uncharacterized protein n=1 Tax=Halobacillus salinus TaxID=192814 RepID=A0A4Z0GY24_9BACI|nr:hypothetical protein [Halobacillus salinus]TGB02347.1 hypothetical protein E4663_13465 [Halobacillus salinus]
MLNVQPNLEVKLDTILKSQSPRYSVRAEGKLVAMVEEVADTATNDWKNQLLNTVRLHTVSSKKFQVTTPKSKVIATIEKARGFSENFDVFIAGNQVATLEQVFHVRSQTVTALSPEGEILLTAEGRNGASDFKIQQEDDRTISSISKRSIPNPSVKEALVAGEIYHVRHHEEVTELEQLIILAMTVMTVEQLHNA